jgi:hypothetical protein
MATAQSAGAEKVSSVNSTTASGLIRWGGPAAVLGGVLAMIGSFFSNNSGAALSGAGFALLVVGIMGGYIHLRHSGHIGPSGTVGFYLCVFAFAVLTILSVGVILNVWGGQWYEKVGLLYGAPVILGSAMFGVAILRSGGLTKGGAWLLIAFPITEVGAIVAMAVSGYTLGDWVWSVPSVVFGLGWVWLGYGLWSESGASAGRSSRVN